MTVLHKRYSEFAALRSMLTNGLSHSEEPEPEPEPEPPGGGAGGDEDPSLLVRGSSSGESLSSYRSIVKMASFPSKAPLRSAGSGQKLAEARRPQLAKPKAHSVKSRLRRYDVWLRLNRAAATMPLPRQR